MTEGMRKQYPSKVTISASPSHSASLSHSKIWEKGRSSGWAAFDLKQRGKQGLESELEIDPYPPIPSAITSLPPIKCSTTNHSRARSFSSVVKPTNFRTCVGNSSYSSREVIVGNSSGKFDGTVQEKNNVDPALKKLKELHSWADDSLIQDILVAVNNNVDQASTLLNSMVSSGSSEESRIIKQAEERSLCDYSLGNNKMEQASKGLPSENLADITGPRSVFDDPVCDSKMEETSGKTPVETELSNSFSHVSLVSQNLIAAPVEPEWEDDDDDIYLRHRRDAVKATRLAAQHSRAASNAFMRGDHFSAQEFSLKAQELWMAAEKLNAKASQEILRIKNSENDIWKLDLHGLHASEAVDALQEHLRKIETQVKLYRSVSPKRIVQPKDEIIGPVKQSGLEASTGKEPASSSPRPSTLQVITGTGNHSRGQASLPSAVRSFLTENGYRFDESRPGVVGVRPKFRRR